MTIDLAALPRDVDALQRLVAEQAGELAAAKAGLASKAVEVEQLELQIARLRRQQFGRSSEKLSHAIEQLELRLEDLEVEALPEPAVENEAAPDETSPRRPGRRPLPAHLARIEVVHEPDCVCPACGGAMRKVGEDVSEILDYIPGRFTVIRHVRPAFSCRACETMVQKPMPSLPIERGRPGPGLLAHILVGKYCDHLPLYRQGRSGFRSSARPRPSWRRRPKPPPRRRRGAGKRARRSASRKAGSVRASV